MLKVKENRKKLWKDWKPETRAQGRCATRLRYAPTFCASLILDHFQYFRYCPAAQIGLKSLRRCQNHNFLPSIVPENLAPGRDVGASRRRPDESQKAVLAHWPWRRSGVSGHVRLANKRRIWYSYLVALRACQVCCRDLTGTDHTVEVTAESLYEAVARALSILHKDAWVDEIGEDLTELRVRVRQPAVEHRVRVRDFWRWLDTQGKTPAECTLKRRLSDIVRPGRSQE